MKACFLAVLLVSALVLASAAPFALAQVNVQGDNNTGVRYVDCSQAQNAVAGQYGNANAAAVADSEAAAEIAQELNISQSQVNACLGTVGGETTEETTKEATTEGKDGEETTVVDGETIIIPKDVASDELPETGGGSIGGYGLAAGCALFGMGLVINRIFR